MSDVFFGTVPTLVSFLGNFGARADMRRWGRSELLLGGKMLSERPTTRNVRWRGSRGFHFGFCLLFVRSLGTMKTW